MDSQVSSQESRWKSFDWWRGETGAVYPRPPSPFPASFETPRVRYHESDEKEKNGGEDHELDDNSSKLSWPGCRGSNTCAMDTSDAKEHNRYDNAKAKKTRVASRRPAWIPPSNLSKTGAIFHPPPYTNRCKETRFNASTAHPMKMTLAPKLKI